MWAGLKIFCLLTHSLIHHFETVPNSKKLQTTTEMWLLTLSQTTKFRLFQNERVCKRQFLSLMKTAEISPKGYKTLWEKEKLLVTRNFSFSHSVFKRIVLQTRKNQGLFGKGLKDFMIQITWKTLWEKVKLLIYKHFWLSFDLDFWPKAFVLWQTLPIIWCYI